MHYISTRQEKLRQHVLVVAHGDGWIEVFSEGNIQVHIEIAPHCPTVVGEELSEDFVEAVIPSPYKTVYFPGFLRAAAQVKKLRPSTVAKSLFVKSVLTELRELSDLTVPKDEERVIWIL